MVAGEIVQADHPESGFDNLMKGVSLSSDEESMWKNRFRGKDPLKSPYSHKVPH